MNEVMMMLGGGGGGGKNVLVFYKFYSYLFYFWDDCFILISLK